MSLADKARKIRQTKVVNTFTAIYQIAKKGNVINISIKSTPVNSIKKTTKFVAFFLTNRVGVLSIRQSKAPGGLSILLTSL